MLRLRLKGAITQTRGTVMTFGGLGMIELMIILVIVLIIFGAGKLPEIGSGLGKGMRNFKRSVSGEGDDDSPAGENELTEEGKDK